ncbi:uncharacterized protein [Temnothorax longispinosus]|uniref:uncharacterized protein n=1 Tax=Temnothorax longispinosus TaxID=300112 RepID=UPI003A9A00DF
METAAGVTTERTAMRAVDQTKMAAGNNEDEYFRIHPFDLPIVCQIEGNWLKGDRTYTDTTGNPRDSKLHTTAARRAQTEPRRLCCHDYNNDRTRAQSAHEASHSWGPTHLVDGC